jgi:hypothetical protein
MLSSTDGIYVTFLIINQANAPVSGAHVVVTRNIGGIEIMVGDATTGPSGGVTFWLNPNIAHTVTVTHPNYATATYTDTFTYSSYTITLGSPNLINVTNYFQGISFNITPTDLYLKTNTNYLFSFNLSSSYWNLSNGWGFNLTNENGIVYAQLSSTNITGGSLSTNLNTLNNKTIRMVYWWDTNAGIQNDIRAWSVVEEYQGGYSIKTFFDRLKLYNASGTFLSGFSMTLIAFVIIFILTGILCYTSGIYSPLAIGGFITGMTWLFTWLGMIGTPNPAHSYIIPILISVLYAAFIIWETVR